MAVGKVLVVESTRPSQIPWNAGFLTSLVTHLRCNQELVLPRKALSATTSHVLKNGVREPRVNVMRGAAGDWTAEKTYQVGGPLHGLIFTVAPRLESYHE